MDDIVRFLKLTMVIDGSWVRRSKPVGYVVSILFNRRSVFNRLFIHMYVFLPSQMGKANVVGCVAGT